jgi:hypothetical protein
MAGILLCEILAQEDMPQVPLAVTADDLCSTAIRVHQSGDCPLNLVIKTRPSASGFEFIH